MKAWILTKALELFMRAYELVTGRPLTPDDDGPR